MTDRTRRRSRHKAHKTRTMIAKAARDAATIIRDHAPHLAHAAIRERVTVAPHCHGTAWANRPERIGGRVHVVAHPTDGQIRQALPQRMSLA